MRTDFWELVAGAEAKDSASSVSEKRCVWLVCGFTKSNRAISEILSGVIMAGKYSGKSGISGSGAV